MEIQIQFDATATIYQTIKVNDGVEKQFIIDGLKNGSLFTTVGHDGRFTATSITDIDGKEYATIVNQSVEGEYTEFHEEF